MQASRLLNLRFNNTSLRELDLDKSGNNQTRQVRGAFWSLCNPTPAYSPELVAASPDALALIGLTEQETKDPAFAEYFCGNKILPGSETAAHCYCGYQFGYFSGQLGDGRAMYLGEVVNEKGEKWEMQLKGAGQTPFSRQADGRAVLRSSIREFLCSEAMHYLGVPTTRAGSIVKSDLLAVRDLRYTGNPIKEFTTVCLRIAPTFIRFGSFEVWKAEDPYTGRGGPSHGLEEHMLPKLLNFVIGHYYPEISQKFPEKSPERYYSFFQEVSRRTALMVAEWQSVGFCHGVMNTDNMSILGLTIDYGPFGFLDVYDPNHICNGSDDSGRYAYKEQPGICSWNLQKLWEALSNYLPADKAGLVDKEFQDTYDNYYHQKMMKKFGFFKALNGDKELIESFFETMRDTGGDFTNIFRYLSKIKVEQLPSDNEQINQLLAPEIAPIMLQLASPQTLAKQSKPDLSKGQMQQLIAMLKSNPDMLQMFGKSPQWINNQIEKWDRYETLQQSDPKEKAAQDRQKWRTWLCKYKTRIFQEIDGLNENEARELIEKRRTMMDGSNPKFILRNWIAQEAIAKAEKGDYSVVHEVFELLKNPFAENLSYASKGYDGLPPDWSADLCVTCSS